jgi:hypothetical protein
MYVQSARFVKAHRGNPAGDLAICGVEGRIVHDGDSNS